MESNYGNGESNKLNANKGETINELAHRHMLNPNHTTTDEELKNARIEFADNSASFEDLEKLTEVDNSTVLPGLSLENNDSAANCDGNASMNKNESSVPNPYDVLK